MKETLDIKELVKICAMNVGLAASFLSGGQCNTFKHLFKRVLIYEKLDLISTSTKHEGASSNVIVKLSHMSKEQQVKMKKENESPSDTPQEP